jgi:FtsP/CotA-like multicopper oxidase with cupredoxin domain
MMRAHWLTAGVALALVVAGVALAVAAMRGKATSATPELGDTSGSTSMTGTTTSGGMEGMEMGGDDTMGGSSSAPPDRASLAETPILSPTRMADMVMPPGMIVTRDTSMEAMRAMAAVELPSGSYRASATVRGARPLAPRIESGVKVFRLETSLIGWRILPNVEVGAYAYNRQVPGPLIRVRQGDRVRVVVTNRLPEPTSVHWHGLTLPNAMDGVADVTQKPIPPGGSFTYTFTAGQAGTFFYHSHRQADRQQSLGLYGALIVDPRTPTVRYDKEAVLELGEWTVKDGYTFPSMQQEGLLPNYFTIDGKAYPETRTLNVRLGQKLLVRFIGSQSGTTHPMHIHGGPFSVVATDGNPVPPAARLEKDTIAVAPGERYDVLWTAQRKGKWLIHCHVLHHTTNDDLETEGGGGLTMVVNVT